MHQLNQVQTFPAEMYFYVNENIIDTSETRLRVIWNKTPDITE